MPSDWSVVATFSEKILAEAFLEVLDAEGLPARIASNGFIPGLGTEFSVLVPGPLLQRAQGLREPSQVSEQELTSLATAQSSDATEEP